MFGYLMLVCGTIALMNALGMIIADKISDYQRKKRLEKALKEPITVRVKIIDGTKTTIDYVDSNEDFQKLLKKHLTK